MDTWSEEKPASPNSKLMVLARTPFTPIQSENIPIPPFLSDSCNSVAPDVMVESWLMGILGRKMVLGKRYKEYGQATLSP